MRKDRIASLLIREISNIVTQDMSDPRFRFVTITKVLVGHDLKEAIVYFSSLNNKPETFEALKNAKGYIKSILAHRIRLRFIPELRFKIDDSYEYGKKIDELIEKISKSNKE
jgi:ribosome-binding factor A